MLITLPVILSCYGCGNDGLPIDEIRNSLKNAPHYSIILDDMKEEGNFFKEYFHKYKVVQSNLSWTKEWEQVPEDYYKMNQGFLGMMIAGKKEGEILNAAAPPGYQYVGDSRYGQWKPDNAGNMLWAFNRGTPLFDELDIDLHMPVYRKNYDKYKYSQSKKIPYFGYNKAYGTNGAFTKKTKPNFFARKMAKDRIKTASFTDKVSKRIGRTKTNFRGRSGSRGK